MRCPNCGTENAPDSRFCGGCGMPFPGPSPQAHGRPALAPTGKIPDDAPIAPPTRPPGPVYGQHVSYAPPAMPYAPTPSPGMLDQVPIPQTPVTVQRHPTPSRAPSSAAPAPAPLASNASMSYVAPPSAPLGLIAFVLFIDLALAGSGAFLLAKGLSKQTDQTDQSVDQRVQKTGKP